MDIFGDQVHYACENMWSSIIPVGYGPYFVNLWRNMGIETVKMIKIQIFKIHVNGLKFYKPKKSCLLLLRRSKHDFLGFLWLLHKIYDDIQLFKINLSTLWSITRKILGQCIHKHDIERFDVVLRWMSPNHRGWEWNKIRHCICDDFT